MLVYMDSSLQVPVNPDDTAGIAEGLIEYTGTPRQTEYLGFRACGFGVREACQLVHISQRVVNHWRLNYPDFAKAESLAVTTNRQVLAAQHLDRRWTRNFAIALEKDYEILRKSVKDYMHMSREEHTYLNKIRALYTPQQLEVLNKLLSGKDGVEDSFASFVLKLSRTREEITLTAVARPSDESYSAEPA